MQITLTDTDVRILQLLQQDASLSAASIAERIGLSQSPCWRRINRLEEAGLVKRRVAVLDAPKLGMQVTVFMTVNLSEHGRQSLAAFEEAVGDFPEVLECYTITGSMDYMLKIVTRDIQHFERFLRDHLSRLAGMREMHSYVAVTEIKCTTELPLATQL